MLRTQGRMYQYTRNQHLSHKCQQISGHARSRDEDGDSVFCLDFGSHHRDLRSDSDDPDDDDGHFTDFFEVGHSSVSKESAKEPTFFVTVSLCML